MKVVFSKIVFFAFLLWGFIFFYPGLLQAQTSANFYQGHVLVGPSITLCSGSVSGAIRFNSTSHRHEYCDGINWLGFAGESHDVFLGIMPGNITGMNVTGPGNPVYGTTRTFTVHNYGAGISDTLNVIFTDVSDNFDIVVDNCTGVTLAANASCTIDIRPKASINGSYTASLSIQENNAPSVTLTGLAEGFGCRVGAAGGGGIYAQCGGAYNLVVTPGGCTNSSTPVCAGTNDVINKTWGIGASDRYNVENLVDGPLNSVNLMAYVAAEAVGVHPAVEFCRNMNYGGFTDWYLPAIGELQNMYSVRASLGGWMSASYVSSTETETTAPAAQAVNSAGSIASISKTLATLTRCVRRETQPLPSPTYDDAPDLFFAPVMTTASTRVGSAVKTINDINTSITASISNDTSGGARLRKNNGAEVTSASLVRGDTLQVMMTSPAGVGGENRVDIRIGSRSLQFRVGVPNEVGTRRIFLGPTGNATSGSGAYNTRCQSAADAAGLNGTWIAILSDHASSNQYASNVMDFNWDTVTTTTGDVVATSWADLWDGSIGSPINKDENGATVSTFLSVYTGSGVDGVPVLHGPANDCQSWSTSTYNSYIGIASSSSSGWINNSSTGACNAAAIRVYCFEQAVKDQDTTPVPFQYDPMTKQATAGTADVLADAKVITGIDANTPISISGTGSPEYRINAGSWTTAAGTINSGDTLTIRADAPAVNNQRNKVKITVGTYSTYWYVGAGNSANIKRVFIRSTVIGSGNLSGVGGADAICSSTASGAGLGTGWRALISDSSEDGYAVNRVPLNWGTLRNMNGANVATSWDDLWDGTVANPINRTQANAILNGNVWTGSLSNGRFDTRNLFSNCENFTSSNGGNNGKIGVSSSTTSTFLEDGTSSCSAGTNYIYCIEE